jgi:opacity protein-like surface antigen
MGSFSRGPHCAVLALRSKAAVKAIGRMLIRATWMSCLLIAAPTASMAQTSVRVTQPQCTIWKPDFRSAAAVVKAGTILTVVGRRDDWFEVVVPESDRTGAATTGFIFKSNVDSGAGPAPSAAARAIAAAEAEPSLERARSVGVLGFGQFGYTQFAARQSFAAVMGQAGGVVFGGGGELRLGRGLFVNGSIERFSKTGQRVFVLDGEVFRLGIADTITLTPITLTAGWRFVMNRATPYIGGGMGRIYYKEDSNFAEAAENVNARFTSYHALGGVEFRNGWVATAFEVQYSHIPGAIGIGGASEAFHESNLGGLVGRVKVLVGR